MKNLILVSAIIIFLASCAPVKLITPTQADVERVKVNYPDYNIAALNEGKLLFEQQCGNCHKLKNPTSKSVASWNKIVPRMVAKANKKEVKIDTKQQDLILKYLVTMSNSKPTQ